MPAQTVIKLRRGTAAQWTSANPTLAEGEPGFETDTGKIKYGDGYNSWTLLPYAAGAADAISWDLITDKPTTFAPSAHTHDISDITGGGLTFNLDGGLSDTNYGGTTPVFGGNAGSF